MAAHALAILKDEDTLNQFKMRARESATKFQTENIVPLYEAVYEKALSVASVS